MTKIGRNEPCPCGSGRKYKQCCGQTEPVLLETAPQGKSSSLDRRAMERTLTDIASLMADKDFSSVEELNAHVQEVLVDGKPPPRRPTTAFERAQDLMYDAWDADEEDERVSLARRALTISADCADAYVLLADERADTLAEAIDLYSQGVEAGERALGETGFAKNAEHFWGVIETRPYMRAEFGLAQCLAEAGNLPGAIEHAWELLRLNPNDNQGVRYPLLAWLLVTGQVDRAQELLDRYRDDIAASWAYGRALLSFKRDGDTPGSRRARAKAMRVNPYVPDYLSGKKRPPDELPAYVGFGDEGEAVTCATEQIAAWSVTRGAVAWLDGAPKRASAAGPRVTSIRRRKL